MAKFKQQMVYNLWTSPTANLSFDLVCLYNYFDAHVEGIRRRGIKEYLKAFVHLVL